MPTVLHVAQPNVAGVANYVVDVASDQASRGWDVHAASPSGGTLQDDLATREVTHHRWEAGQRPDLDSLRELRELQRVVAAVRPDVVHLHSSKAGMVGRLLLRGRIPTLFQPHAWSFLAVEGPIRAATLRWERIAARWAHHIVCVSAAERDQGREAGVHADYVVVPNGVDTERFAFADPSARGTAREQLGLADVPTAMSIGRLHRQKAQHVLLEVWPYVREAVPDAELVLVGDGPERASLEAAAPAGVTFAGSRSDVRPWIAAADVITMPSRWEGLSLSLLEALSSGRPVVASDAQGMHEVLLAGEAPAAGAVVPVSDRDGFADAIVERLRHRDRAEAEGRAGRQRIEATYDIRDTRQKVADLTLRLAGRTTASA